MVLGIFLQVQYCLSVPCMEIDIVLLVCRVMDSRNLKRENPADRQPTKIIGKRKRCDKCGCQCMSSKKGWTGSSSDRGQKLTPPKQHPRCPTYRRYHYGECQKATGGCYRYGDLGHHFRDCPKPSRKNRKISKGNTEGAETSTAQEAPYQVPAQVNLIPHPEAEVAPEVNLGIEISRRNFYKEGRIVTTSS